MNNSPHISDLGDLESSDAYKFLAPIFGEDSIQLAIETIYGLEDIHFYDELLQNGKISFEELMEVIRFQPEVYQMLSRATAAAELLAESIPEERYKYVYDALNSELGDALEQGNSTFQEYHGIIDFHKHINNLGTTLDLQGGMLRTIAFNHFLYTLQTLHFQKIAQYAESIEEYEKFCIPYRITPEGTEVVPWEDSRLKAAFLERARRDIVYLLNHKNLINSLPASEQIDVEEILVLAENRNIQEEVHQIGNVSITITHRNNIQEDYSSLFASNMEIAYIIVEAKDEERGNMKVPFILDRDGTLLSVPGGSLDKLMDANSFDIFKNTIYKLLRDNLNSVEEDPSISYPDLFGPKDQTEIETVEAVDDILDETETKQHIKLGSVKSTWLHRRLTVLLGPPTKGRGKGSHQIYTSRSGKTVPVPAHAGKDIGKGLLQAIMKQLDISPEELKGE